MLHVGFNRGCENILNNANGSEEHPRRSEIGHEDHARGSRVLYDVSSRETR